MGEIADDMISGRCCSYCGQYFATTPLKGKLFPEREIKRKLTGHGYSVLCKECWDEAGEDERNNYQMCEFETL